MDQTNLTRRLKQHAKDLGLEACGVSKAIFLKEEASLLQKWLDQDRQASMSWMNRHFKKRTDPRLLVENAKSVVSVLHNYYNKEDIENDQSIGKISRYAWNRDYHKVLKKKLAELLDWLGNEVGGVKGRVFVDSAPVMDKAWAARSGLGWIGKHSNLINQSMGSFFFIGEIIVDIELDYDSPTVDHCGTCTLCIDACPTDAIVQPYVVDANKCISYVTIEHREDDIDLDIQKKIGNWIFGCDICQDVCPWNKFSLQTTEADYIPKDDRNKTKLKDWRDLSEKEYENIFAGSAVKRAGYNQFMRNIRIASVKYLNGD